MTKREQEMVVFAYELFLEQLAMLKSNRTTLDEVIERVRRAKERMSEVETRQDYEEEE